MSPTLYQQIGARVRTYRKLRQLTQEQLAERVNLSVHYLSRIETGKATATLQSLERLAKGVRVQLEEFFHFPEDERQDRRTLLQEILALLKGRTPKELRMVRSVVRQLVEVLPASKLR